MCGILGVVPRDPQLVPDRARLAAARDTLTHRGPDEAGLWAAPGIGLAHRRLKVLDLIHGQQPMRDHDTAPRHALVYNGEVYNYRQLRADLEQAGHAFRGDGDTEVLFHALAAHGPDAIDTFDGMFALGHWDHDRRRLLLVRDRLGQKPLYWHRDDERLVFASELKALLHYLGRRFDVDAAALDEFFTRGYVLAPRTIFRGIQKLPAAGRLRLDAQAWEIAEDRYWDVEPGEASPDHAADDAVDRLDELLTDAVAKRMVSDVPLGCLLSGGIDSSLVTAIAAKQVGRTGGGIAAFSIGFDESKQHNELPYAQQVAERYGCDWRREMVRGGDFLADLDQALRYFDEPFGNFTVIAQRKLAKLCRRDLTVVLSGTGGDELTAGYPGRYNWVNDVPHGGPRHAFTAPIDGLNQYLARSSFVGWRGGREAMFSEPLRRAVGQAHSPADAVDPYWMPRGRAGGLLNQVLYADVKTNLPDYLVTIEERMTMSASLEARNPLLDHRVVDYLMSRPAGLKIRGGQNKWLLWKLCERYLPREVYDRPKRGFTPPLGQWLTQNAARLAAHFAANQETLSQVFSAAWQGFLQAGRYDPASTMPVYYSLVLTKWAEHYGDYLGAWPGADEAEKTNQPSGGLARRQATFREQTPAALGEARWFAQALSNFPADATLRVTGADAGFFAGLAQRLGYPITDDANNTYQVFLGAEAVRSAAWGFTGEAVLLVPFDPAEQAVVQQLMSSLPTGVEVLGGQGVQVDTSRGMMIARVRVAAASAAATPMISLDQHVG
ncbi:MAG: asparagine synthase (glutamine-hydrolyzing) [Planctomycetota bacterium]